MTLMFSEILWWTGLAQWCVLVASALVPLRLDWRSQLAALPLLLRQLMWIYGGYIVLCIISMALVCMLYADELASGTPLARAVCLFGAVFWGVRLALQSVLAVRPHLTTWWLRAGYHMLTAMFLGFTVVYVSGACRVVS